MIQTAVLPLFALLQTGAEEPPPAAVAWQPFDYSFIDVSYVHIDTDEISDDANGFAMAASLNLSENAFGFLGLQSATADVSGGDDADLDVLELGVGMHTPLGERFDAVGSVSALLADAEALGLDDDEFGFRLRAGGRYHLTQKVELAGGFGVAELDDPETFLDAAVLFGLTDMLHLRGGLEYSDEATGIFLGLRVYPGS
jgi:hypothetical protein